ncbi:putative RING-H2 finger protein ATL21A [Pyrus communis]|uniref:putative RING-H2 finger protein ATL21A n=1 Tax=Pyrus communis TaxID=23211 RepID=UPI0035BFA82C
MDISHLLFLLLVLLFTHISALNDCPASDCGSDDSFPIRFPFRLVPKQPKNCGFPGFNLACNSHGQTTLKLPNSGDFFVRRISYATQEIQLFDPEKCLPRKLLTLNLSGSPFVAPTYKNYTFLSCPASFTKSRFTPIDCLSNSTTSVLATPSATLANSMSATCRIVDTLEVPVCGQVLTEDGFSTNLDWDLSLTWYEPSCSSCEVEGRICGFITNTTQELGCTFNSTAGGSSYGLYVFRIICLSITVPATTCAIAIGCFACISGRGNAAQRRSTAVNAEPPPQPPAVVTIGLDQTTIESYQMLVLGESKRLPGHNDSTCAICLSEYLTEETVRCIPECKHCFHADCIDEWLKLNSSCPVCRNNPSPAHVNSTSPAHVNSTSPGHVDSNNV